MQNRLVVLGKWVMGKFRSWTRPYPHSLVMGAITQLSGSRHDLRLENAWLRQQLIVVERHVNRPTLTWRGRALFVVLASRLKTWKETLLIVKPETLLRWHRDLFGWVWRRKSRVTIPIGRPALASERVALIRRMAKDNILWGTERIRGELLKLGLPVARSTIQKYLKGRRAAGSGSQTWTTFIHNHASAIWACDFLQTNDFRFHAILCLSSSSFHHGG